MCPPAMVCVRYVCYRFGALIVDQFRAKVYLLSRGSSASRRPSPTNAKESIVIAIAKVGNSPRCQYTRIYEEESATILPQLGVGSLIPKPRKLSPASVKITVGIPSVTATISGETALGSR